MHVILCFAPAMKVWFPFFQSVAVSHDNDFDTAIAKLLCL